MTSNCLQLSNLNVPREKPSSSQTLSLISWTQKGFVLSVPTIWNNFPNSSLLGLVLFSLQDLCQVPPTLKTVADFPTPNIAFFQTSIDLVVTPFLLHLPTWFIYCLFSLCAYVLCFQCNSLFLQRHDLLHFCVPESMTRGHGHVMRFYEEVRQRREVVKNTDCGARLPEFWVPAQPITSIQPWQGLFEKTFCTLVSASLK